MTNEPNTPLEPLHNSEKPFHALADNLPQLAWMADATGWIFWYNHRWFDYTGTTLAEMQGWGWQKIHHPDYVEAVTEKFRTCLALGASWEDTFPLKGADGRFRWFLSRATPVKDAAGTVTLWCGTNTDVTEQREAEAALIHAEASVKSLYELTSRTDLSFVQKMENLLHKGRKWLGLDTGVLARTDCDAGTYQIVHIDSSGETPPLGYVCPLDQTFCSETVKRGLDSPPLAVEHAGDIPEWRDHSAYKAFGSEAYLAAIVRVGDAVWGTLTFVGKAPRQTPFTSFDSDIVRLMAQWVGGEITRQEAEATLQTTALQQRRFVREMLASVTEGRLCLCDDPAELSPPLPPASEVLELREETLRILRKRVVAAAADMNLSEERTQDILTAVGEASMNAVKHGGGGTARVHLDTERGILQVRIRDSGKGIRQEDLHRATLEKGWSGGGSLGHGFYLMLRTADRTYLLTNGSGTTVVLEQEPAPPEPTWINHEPQFT